jgi:hypothetical protein
MPGRPVPPHAMGVMLIAIAQSGALGSPVDGIDQRKEQR